MIENLSDGEKPENIDSLNDTQLKELLEARKKELEVLQRHQREKQQLLEYKEKWKNVGNEALEVLNEYYKTSREELLLKMGVASDAFD